MGRPNRRPGRSKGAESARAPLTHFLCIPLITATSRPQLEAALTRFRDLVARPHPGSNNAPSSLHADDATSTDIHPKAIRPVGTLHLTLGVMSLTEERLQDAVTLLESLSASSLVGPSDAEQSPVSIDLRGLDSMHAPEKTSILYCGPTDLSSRLHPLCLSVQALFKEHGFLVADSRPLKLHATIVNTIYAKGRKRSTADVRLTRDANAELKNRPEAVDAPERLQPNEDDRSQGHGPRANAPLKIDARPLLASMKEFVWAKDLVLDRLTICEMGARKVLNGEGEVVDEQYREVASISLLR